MIDRRSDTVTLPTEAMRDAMARAELGDDSRERDPTVVRLEELAAGMTGKDAAMFVTSGTMANLVSLLAHGRGGGDVLLEAESHILRSEVGGIARLTGLFHRTVPGTRGAPDLYAVRELISAPSTNSLGTALVCVETTHNSAGGAVIPLARLAKLRATTAENGIPLHIDGARVFNAAVKLGVPVSEIAKHGDSIVFCVSKGLSAPFGSIVCGSTAFIERARAFRRMVGGAMRQAGVMAAAGLVALEQMVDRLADDHKQAAKLAKGIHGIDRALVDPQTVETNIVMIDVSRTGADAKTWLAALAAQGVRAGAWTPTQLRLVTHRHIDAAAVEGAIGVFRDVAAEFRPSLAAVH